ncbi:threonine synthase [Deinococcus proteolyticus MRP]|uniref:Threonine synthase n=1 Tax=Deinococcus proteolyticus (strain ATCC 35074 / DSM 20540 / JCM 6276 / NBRC 101906 / NCIMB 13154 / VKM Ac-1939 / CCM 2703 / MRP) TaxID=693977 RepID=F0RJ89_DEIPM|nr:threonine synthase [Deinococcus proteolyticus]ADY26526.1 threonine synthase [Deinococcus proteolyticus MRP]
MQYVSTRGHQPLGTFTDVLLSGLAPDGGLAMPERISTFSAAELERLRELPYVELAYEVMHPFISDIPEDDLRELLRRTYRAEVFGSEDITPLTALGDSGLYLLELSNGPSLAFKDMAMQFLGHAFEYVLEREDRRVNILGATSGDTGSAAEYAMLGKERVNVFMLSPQGRMSRFQQAQMYSLDEPNIFNIAVAGVFDDCQDLVKAVNADAEFKARYDIGAVNSINWGRVLAQAVYYFKGYFALNLPAGAEADFCVPSGNFGNVFAGYLAREMGLPVGRLIVASNENSVLHEFFSGGVYHVWPAERVAVTSSPSMDIGKASNFERFLYLMADADAGQVGTWWEEVAAGRPVDLRESAHWAAVQASGFAAGRSSHADRLATIRRVDTDFGRLIDPHTADGVLVGESFKRPGVPMVCLETALPAKFAETVREAVGREPARPARFAGIEERPRHFTELPNDAEALKAFIAEKLGEWAQ